ncbi:BMP family ABC transporter substrate-binding protein [Halosimplex sp. J119]
MSTDITRRRAIKALGLAGAAGLAGCSGSGDDGTETSADTGTSGDGGSGGSDTVKAAFVYNSAVGDQGWSWAHEQGRQAVAEQYDWLESDYSEDVAPADAKPVFQQYVQNDYDVVFGNTFGYMDTMVSVAEDNPDVLFEHCSGYQTLENMGRYFGRMYQARYMAGVAAGMLTEANTLGFVAAMPLAEVVRGINAFTLGARSVNEDVTTKVRWTNEWYDPPKEKEAANALIDQGVDVMAQHQDSAAAVQAAADAGIWATGYDAPMDEQGGDSYVTSPIWHWEKFYGPTLEAVRDGSWEPDFYWEGLEDGIVGLSDWGPEVPDDVKSSVEETRSAIESGETDVWTGSKFADADDATLFQDMSSFVEGVEGTVPE